MRLHSSTCLSFRLCPSGRVIHTLASFVQTLSLLINGSVASSLARNVPSPFCPLSPLHVGGWFETLLLPTGGLLSVDVCGLRGVPFVPRFPVRDVRLWTKVSLVGLVVAMVEVGKNLVGFRQDGVAIFQDRYIVLTRHFIDLGTHRAKVRYHDVVIGDVQFAETIPNYRAVWTPLDMIERQCHEYLNEIG